MLRSLGKTEPLDFGQRDVGSSTMDGILVWASLIYLLLAPSVCLYLFLSFLLSLLSLHFTSLLHPSAHSLPDSAAYLASVPWSFSLHRSLACREP